MAERRESLSSRALGEYAREVSLAKLSADTGIHRTQLWRYATGRGKPDADQIAKLHRASGGRVAADGWETLPAEGSVGVEPPEEDEDAPASSPRPAKQNTRAGAAE